MLSVNVRELMLKALRELSTGPSARLENPPKALVQEALAAPAPVSKPAARVAPAAKLPVPASVPASAQDADSVRRRTTSTASSSGRDAGVETEDEGWTKVAGQ